MKKMAILSFLLFGILYLSSTVFSEEPGILPDDIIIENEQEEENEESVEKTKTNNEQEQEIKQSLVIEPVINLKGDKATSGSGELIGNTFTCFTNSCGLNFNANNSTVNGESVNENCFTDNSLYSCKWDNASKSLEPYKRTFEKEGGDKTITFTITEKNNTSNYNTAYFYVKFEILPDMIEPSNDENSGTGNLEDNNSDTNLGDIVETPEIILLDIKYSFQSPSYVTEYEKDLVFEGTQIFNCDRSKDECKVNFDFTPSFTGGLKEKDFLCSIDFGFDDVLSDKCNPNTIIFPVGSSEVNIKITDEKNENHFGEAILTIINEGKQTTSSTTNTYIYSSSSSSSSPSQIDVSLPYIKIQSGLDTNNKCDKEECSVNFIYETDEKVNCTWDFGEGVFPEGTEEKCNPTYVKYGSGKHKVKLEVCDKNYDWNCKNTSLEFENVYEKISEDEKHKISEDKSSQTSSEGQKDLVEFGGEVEIEAKITLQGRQAKTKIIEENKIICTKTESCSVNFTGENSIGEKLTYFWDFGNGQTSEKSNPNSIVFDEGEYTTILAITDKNGNTDETNFDVIVQKEEFLLKVEEIDNNGSLVLGGNAESDEKEEKQENIKLKIELQGKIGANKILNGNNLTCIKTCSVNFDGSESEGKFSSYFWDFGNGEIFEGKNPGYISYEDFGEYVVLFSVEDDIGNIYEEEFFIDFVEKDPNKKVANSSKTENNETSFDFESFDTNTENDVLVEFGGIDYNENNDNPKTMSFVNEKHFGKYIIFSIIILSLGGGFVLLRRYNIF